MEEEIKVRFEELDKRILSSEKYFGDIKWYFGGITSLFTIGFSVLVLLLSWNYNFEKIALREFQKDMKADLGRVDPPPALVLLGTNRNPLDNQDIKAKVFNGDDGVINLEFDYAIKNEGTSPSGPLYNKIYTSNPIKLSYNSIDESKFNYESYGSPKTFKHEQLPGGNFIGQYTLTIGTKNNKITAIGKYPILLKIYYAKGKCVRANFNLVLGR